MIKVKILINDPGNRFQAGEEGILLVNNFTEKYDYFVRLNGDMETLFGDLNLKMKREFYFYKNEIELLA